MERRVGATDRAMSVDFADCGAYLPPSLEGFEQGCACAGSAREGSLSGFHATRIGCGQRLPWGVRVPVDFAFMATEIARVA